MKSVLCTLTTVLACLLLAGLAAAQAKKGDPAAAAQEKAQENMMPGPAHKQLAKLAGEYTTVSKMTFRKGDTPMESKGTAKLSVILEGRFLTEEDSGMMMGMPYKGFRLMGYNNATRQYESVWTYSMSTGMMNMTGTSKDGGKTIDYTASYTNEAGSKETLYVSMRLVDDNTFVVKLYGKEADGSEGPTFETTYTRKK